MSTAPTAAADCASILRAAPHTTLAERGTALAPGDRVLHAREWQVLIATGEVLRIPGRRHLPRHTLAPDTPVLTPAQWRAWCARWRCPEGIRIGKSEIICRDGGRESRVPVYVCGGAQIGYLTCWRVRGSVPPERRAALRADCWRLYLFDTQYTVCSFELPDARGISDARYCARQFFAGVAPDLTATSH